MLTSDKLCLSPAALRVQTKGGRGGGRLEASRASALRPGGGPAAVCACALSRPPLRALPKKTPEL